MTGFDLFERILTSSDQYFTKIGYFDFRFNYVALDFSGQIKIFLSVRNSFQEFHKSSKIWLVEIGQYTKKISRIEYETLMHLCRGQIWSKFMIVKFFHFLQVLTTLNRIRLLNENFTDFTKSLSCELVSTNFTIFHDLVCLSTLIRPT